MSPGKSARQVHVVFSGRVQGVGFRYTVHRIAEVCKVNGYVRNCSDGTVELRAEGSEQVLAEFLNEIRGSGPGRYITGERIGWSAATGEFSAFRVAF